MTCAACEDKGIVPFVAHDNPKPDAEIGTADLRYAMCLCPAGLWMRSNRNANRATEGCGWMVWAATYAIDPACVCFVEDVFSAEDLAAVGLSRQPARVSREAALLTAAKARKGKL